MSGIIEPLLDNYIEKLRKIRQNIKFNKLETLDIVVSKSKELKDRIESLGNKGYIIYIMTVEDNVSLDELGKEKRKSKELHYSFPQVNEEHVSEDNKYLYVGSSLKISTRLRQHLFKCPKKTFSLRLNNWAKGRRVNIELYETDTKDNMQLFEDLLWEEYKPMLGKRGSTGLNKIEI